MNDLHTCRSCRHWSATGYDERYSPGSCAIGAWVKSWTPGIGYGFSPFPDYARRCAGWESA